MNALVRLDERVVPLLARGLRRAVDASAVLFRDSAALRALDDRFGRRGPVALLANVPGVGLVLVLALLIAGIAGAAAVDGRHASPAGGGGTAIASAVPAGCPVGQAGAGSAYVGAIDGEPVATYAAGRRQVLAQCVNSAPQTVLLALVSLRALVTPTVLQGLLSSVRVASVYVVLAQSPTHPYVLDIPGAGVTGLTNAVDAAFATAAAEFGTQAAGEISEAEAIGSSQADAVGRAGFLAAAHSDSLSQAALADHCGCIYGALVSAPVATLAALGAAVRVVDLAPAGANQVDVTGRPLLPSETASLGSAAPPVAVVTGDL